MDTPYTLIIGTKNWSSWSLRPYLALYAIGAPFHEIVIPLRRDTTTAEILRHSPTGRIPVLRIDGGGKAVTVWDSLAICETLSERHPDARLWPDDPMVRAEARAYAAEMHSGFPDLREQLSMDFTRRLPMPELRPATEAQIALILSAWNEALSRHAGDGGLLFGRFSIADCMYAPVVSRFLTYGVAMPERVQTYAERLMALAAMRAWGEAAKEEVAKGLG